MESVRVEAAPTQDASEFIEFKLSLDDRFEMMELAADLRIKTQELQLARVRLDAAKSLSDAEADKVLAKMGVPKDAQDVTIDTNQGIVRFKVPTCS
jgi:hypothetical protein